MILPSWPEESFRQACNCWDNFVGISDPATTKSIIGIAGKGSGEAACWSVGSNQ